MVQRIFLYCDESGAKGYADQKEAFPGEVGVFAGIMVPEDQHDALSVRFDAIARQFKPARGKLHIADLPNEQKEALRQALFKEIQDAQLPCFWYAIHVEGLHADHVSQVDLRRATKAAIEASRKSPPRVKTGSPRDEPASLHVELFAGLYSHVVAFLLERNRNAVELEVRTDQVDTPLAKRFNEVAESLLSMDPNVTETTGFDTVTKQVVHGQVSVSIHCPAEMEIPPIIRSLSITPVDDSNGIVLAADVLANSLNHHFKNRAEDELYSPLNRPEAIAGHPLFASLDAFENWGDGDIIGDRVYVHPRARNSK
jgi:hypothetical protein